GAWGLGSVLMFDALFSGMPGVDYGAQGFETGYGGDYPAVLAGGQEGGFDSAGDGGGDFGGDFGGFDF
ncbi:MAG: DUF1542 domain-containing protein, partial [Mycobacterium sp.]